MWLTIAETILSTNLMATSQVWFMSSTEEVLLTGSAIITEPAILKTEMFRMHSTDPTFRTTDKVR